MSTRDAILRFLLRQGVGSASNLANSLGVSEVKLIDIVSAYSAIANNGILVKPISITSIFDNENHEIKQFYPDFKEVANENHLKRTQTDHQRRAGKRFERIQPAVETTGC